MGVMANVCRDFTFDVAWRLIIGLKLNDAESIEFHDAVMNWLSSLVNPLIYLLPRFMVKQSKGHKAKIYLNSVIEKKIDYLEKHGPDGSTLSGMLFYTDDDENTEKSSARHLTREQVIDNTMLLIAAGSETSSSTLTNVMLLLGMCPQVWEKLVAEQRQLLSQHGPTLTRDIIDKESPYLEAVIKEVMRVLPVSGGGYRNIDETVSMNGIQIPKGWMAIYSIFLTHKQDPVTFQEDGSHMDIQKGFHPERWLQKKTRPNTEYIPFGAGHRFCLGKDLAMLEMKVFIAILARKIQFQLVNDPLTSKWSEGFIITPKDGCEIIARNHDVSKEIEIVGQ